MLPRLQLVPPNTRLFKDDPVEIYLESKQGRGRRTQRQKLTVAAEILGVQPADLSLHLSYRSVSAVRAFLLDAGRAPRTVNATLSGLKGVAKVAAHLGVITPEEHDNIKAVKSVRGSRVLSGRWVNDGEKVALFDACARDASLSGARDAAVLAVQFRAGLRREECALLRVPHYSRETQVLLVLGKGNKERTVPCQAAAPVLNDWLELSGANDGPMFRKIMRGVLTDLSLSDQAIYDIYKRRAKQAGLASTSPHDARRTYCTELLEARNDLSVVQKLMGHASITTTERYDLRGERAKRKAAATLSLPYTPRSSPQLALPFLGPSDEFVQCDSRAASDGG